MEKFLDEGYGNLPQIVDETIKQTLETKNFNLGLFLQRMEEEFKRLGFREQSKGGVQKILLLRLDAVGDFILMSPSIRAIRENFPRAHITLVVTKAVYAMAELCPYVNEVIIFETPHKSSIDNNDILQILKTALDFSANHLWKHHFDLNLTFLNDFTHAVMSYMSGSNIRIGFGGGLSNALMTKPVPLDYSKVVHHVEKNLYILQACGLKVQSADLELWYGIEDLRQAENILGNFSPNRLKIAFGLGANHVERRYPVEKYLIALKKIINKGAAIILLGGPSEIDDAKFLEKNLPKKFVKNVAEIHPGWRVDSAIISKTDMYIGNDTGTQHVASALKKPVIILSRESKDREKAMRHFCEHILFAPWQTKSITLLPDHPLGDCIKKFPESCWAGKPHCITQIKPEEIVVAFEEMKKIIKS